MAPVGRQEGQKDGQGREKGLFFPPLWHSAAGRGELQNSRWCFQAGIYPVRGW